MKDMVSCDVLPEAEYAYRLVVDADSDVFLDGDWYLAQAYVPFQSSSAKLNVLLLRGRWFGFPGVNELYDFKAVSTTVMCMSGTRYVRRMRFVRVEGDTETSPCK